MYLKYFFLLFSFVFISNRGLTQNSKSFQKKMNFWLSWYHIPGCQITFIKDGEISKTFNFRSTIYRDDNKVKSTTLFQTGKVNQIYTSLALMKTISDHNLNGNKDVNTLLTHYKLRNSVLNKNRKTIAFQLLNHSGGINRPNFNPLESDISLSTMDLLKGSKITKKKKVHNFQTPLKSYLYSEGAFSIARLIIEENSNLSYFNYIDTFITPVLAAPFNYNGFDISDGKKAFSHEYSKWAIDMPNLFPNPEGYGNWMSSKTYAQLVIDVLEDKQISQRLGIKAKLYNQFITPVIKIKDTDYSSCAVFEKHDFEKGVFRLIDSRNGFRSWAYYDTDSKEGVVILINSEYDYLFSKKKGKVLDKIKKFSEKYGYLKVLAKFLEN